MAEPIKPIKINWYRTKLTREQMSALNRKSDLLGWLQTGGTLALYAATGGFAVWAVYHLHWSIAVAAFMFHGMCMQFTINAFHELIHDSVFKTRWLNRFFLQMFSFLGWHNHHHFWASHTEHHKYTLHPPADLEVTVPRCDSFKGFWKTAIVNPMHIKHTIVGTWRTAAGRVRGRWSEHLFPESDVESRKKLRHWSQFVLVGHLSITAFCFAMGWWFLPLATSFSRVFLPGVHYLCNETQHTGLPDNVPDFRVCCRTIYLNPFLQFLYWHMNYHIEHHMYAGVPCYKLSKLHKLIKHDLGPCRRGLVAAWKQIDQIHKRQKAEPGYQFDPGLPQPQAA